MDFEAFDQTAVREARSRYAKEVAERWGGTEAYRESERRTAAYGEREWAAAQAEMEERLAPVAGAVMVSHEKLDDGLTRTSYDNGWTVYVNYGAQARTIGGTTIPAMDYAAVKEAA